MSAYFKSIFITVFFVFSCSLSFATTDDDWTLCRQALTEIEDASNIKDMHQLKIGAVKLKQACANTRSPQSLYEESSYHYAYAEMMLGNLDASFQVSRDCIEKFYFSPRCHMLITSYFYMKKDLNNFKSSIEKGTEVANVVAKRLKNDLNNTKKITPKSYELSKKIAELELDIGSANSVVDFYKKFK